VVAINAGNGSASVFPQFAMPKKDWTELNQKPLLTMTTRFFSFILLFITCAATAQNLVPNHSFEEFVDGCPSTFNGTVALGWERWANSPDLFSTCVDPQNFSDSLGWVPWNGLGYQWPADGESYAGLFACGSPGFSQNFREYLGCELLEPLEIGETYYISFKTSMGFTGHYYNVTYASNRMGAYFTMQGYHLFDNPLEIPNFAHVYEESIIVDTVNWVTISGSFVADQPYTHMGIGVFYDFDSLEVLQLVPGSSLGSYYFIDDVCVSRFPECDVATSSEWSDEINTVQIYPNPAQNQVVVESTSMILRLGLLDLAGKWIKPPKGVNEHRVIWSLDDIPSGVYILDIETTTGTKRKKLVIVY
jgi:hypothetical protein